jgi:transposase
MKATADQVRARSLPQRPPAEHEKLVARYREQFSAELAANPPPRRRLGRRGRKKQTPAHNLLEHLMLGLDQVVASFDDLTIPFDNREVGRNLRTLRLRQKVSGAFRSGAGADAFARIRSYLSTPRKQGAALLAGLETIFAGQPICRGFAGTVTPYLLPPQAASSARTQGVARSNARGRLLPWSTPSW